MRAVSRRRVAKDRVLTLTMLTLSALTVGPMAHILLEVVAKGAPVVLSAGFKFFTDPPPPPGGGELGGIGPVIEGTAAMVALAALISLPVGTLAAVYMSEYPRSRLTRVSEAITHLLVEFPSIVVSLFVYTVIVVPMGTPSTLAGAISLAIMMLPYVTTQVREALRSIPSTHREAAFALGLSRAKAVFYVFFGIARRGILSGAILGLAKATGETAPVLFTAGSAFYGFYGLTGPAGTVTLLIYKFAQTPYANWQQVAWGAAFILVAAVVAAILGLRFLVREVRL
ncbi:MAG: phosphate ABC transporter permease PstA [Candidatus Korarchaeota archaeon]|nr:phosphate ABC transporter permease PstA [Candidatus Korarchaeota archaeon]